ncbi:MAG: FAD/NAD(P)-binding protein [candidate division WOR-3 bacterium]
MNNPFLPKPARLVAVREETPNIKTFVLKPEEEFSFAAGQFAALTVPGVGEAFFTPSSSPFVKEEIEFTIMRVGRVTTALFARKEGEVLGLRGPFGKPYPLEKFIEKEVFLVGGGVGLAPLRSLFLALVAEIEKYKKVYLRYGARTPKDLVYKKELKEWAGYKKCDLLLTVDVGDATWKGRVGVVTTILDKIPCDVRNSVSVVCGPPIMMKFVTKRLLEVGFSPKDIYLSMEKNMSCAIGMCGHCRLGRYFICQDGPVLTWEQVKEIEDPFV